MGWPRLGAQVVASENGRRPPGVVRYAAKEARDMREKVNEVLRNIEAGTLKQNPQNPPEVDDTVETEISCLKTVLS